MNYHAQESFHLHLRVIPIVSEPKTAYAKQSEMTVKLKYFLRMVHVRKFEATFNNIMHSNTRFL